MIHNLVNPSAGATLFAQYNCGNDGSATATHLRTTSTTFTPTGVYAADGAHMVSERAGGLALATTHASGTIRFFTNATQRGLITAAGLLNWTTAGRHSWIAGAAGEQSVYVQNTTGGAGSFGRVSAVSDVVTANLDSYSSAFTTAGSQVQSGSALSTDGSGGLSLVAAHAAGLIRFYTGGQNLRASYDADGNYRFGSTSILDSPAVPTLNSVTGGTATISGQVAAFRINVTGGTVSGITVDFNTTFTNIPAVVANTGAVTNAIVYSNPSTTQAVFLFSPSLAAGTVVNVICRGL